MELLREVLAGQQLVQVLAQELQLEEQRLEQEEPQLVQVEWDLLVALLEQEEQEG